MSHKGNTSTKVETQVGNPSDDILTNIRVLKLFISHREAKLRTYGEVDASHTAEADVITKIYRYLDGLLFDGLI